MERAVAENPGVWLLNKNVVYSRLDIAVVVSAWNGNQRLRMSTSRNAVNFNGATTGSPQSLKTSRSPFADLPPIGSFNGYVAAQPAGWPTCSEGYYVRMLTIRRLRISGSLNNGSSRL